MPILDQDQKILYTPPIFSALSTRHQRKSMQKTFAELAELDLKRITLTLLVHIRNTPLIPWRVIRVHRFHWRPQGLSIVGFDLKTYKKVALSQRTELLGYEYVTFPAKKKVFCNSVDPQPWHSFR